MVRYARTQKIGNLIPVRLVRIAKLRKFVSKKNDLHKSIYYMKCSKGIFLS